MAGSPRATESQMPLRFQLRAPQVTQDAPAGKKSAAQAVEQELGELTDAGVELALHTKLHRVQIETLHGGDQRSDARLRILRLEHTLALSLFQDFGKKLLLTFLEALTHRVEPASSAGTLVAPLTAGHPWTGLCLRYSTARPFCSRTMPAAAYARETSLGPSHALRLPAAAARAADLRKQGNERWIAESTCAATTG